MYLWLKAVHVIAIISWMAGLLYLFRLFVYHAMERETVVMERLQVMERRLLNAITTPAAVLALITGASMLVQAPDLLRAPWMLCKLGCVVGLMALHTYAALARRRLIASPNGVPHRTFRVLNELPTLLMIVIVIMVIVRPFTGT
ncbi:MAG: protoporphyrinogen oxidase HemJ [Deltaproteobacteria bacterium]|nr:protoporphyrinogen oxidase HemJ [Deltaproteobacteria bacterium]